MSDTSHAVDPTHYDPNFTSSTPPANYPHGLPFPLSLPYPSHYDPSSPVVIATYDRSIPSPYDPSTSVPYDPNTGVPYDPSTSVPYDSDASPYDPSLAPAYNSSGDASYLQTLQDTSPATDLNDVEMKSNTTSTSEMLRAIREDMQAQGERMGQGIEELTDVMKDSMNGLKVEFLGAVTELKDEIVSMSKIMKESMESNNHFIRQMTGRDIAHAVAAAAAEAVVHGVAKLSTKGPGAQAVDVGKGDLEEDEEDEEKDVE